MSFDRLLSFIGLAATVAVIVLAFTLQPDPRGTGTHEQLGLPPCGFLRDHGVPCIACGMTTAFSAMAHGDLGLAVRANPFGCLLFVVILLAPIHFAHSLVKDYDPLRIFQTPRARIVLPIGGVLLLINWGILVLIAKAEAA